MKPLVMIIVFTGVLNLFFTKEDRVLVDFWGITITAGGAERPAFMVVRILMLVTCTFLLTYTTSPISLTDGLERLLSPLKVIKVACPRAVHDDVHCPAVHPHADRGDGQDHVRPESPGRRL